MSKPIYIVGGGVFGITVGAALLDAGHNVTIYDCSKPESGSRASGGMMAPSWLSAFKRKEIDDSYELLDKFFGVDLFNFDVLPTKKQMKLYRLNMRKVFSYMPVHVGEVTEVHPGWLRVAAPDGKGLSVPVEGTIIVAAGVWSRHLTSLPDMKIKKGVSFNGTSASWPGHQMKVWAPYKQAIVTTDDDGRWWAGDGSAIFEKNWKPTQEDVCWARLRTAFPAIDQPAGGTVRSVTGLRPFLNDGCRKLADDLWLCTGGGKNGSALAGIYAKKMVEALS